MNGDETHKQFLAAYDQYADAIFKHIYYRVYDRQLAEDLTQDTFAKTWKYIADGKKVENLRAFLYRTAKNLIIDYVRKKKEMSLDQLLDDGFQPSRSEEKQNQARIEAQKLIEQIMKLPEREADLLIMRYVEDLSPKEISENLGKSQNAISVSINRAVKKLRKLIGHE